MSTLNKVIASAISAGAATLLVASSASAATVPVDQPLPDWGDSASSSIDFTGVAIEYRNGRTKKGVTADSTFFGTSRTDSHFFLNQFGTNAAEVASWDGQLVGNDWVSNYNSSGTEFAGDFIIDANISSQGRLRDGSTFGFYSMESQFATVPTTGAANPVVDYGCNKQGKGCSSGMLVYGGDIYAFGWEGTAGILEFVTNNLDGWALDMWNPNATAASQEHIYLDVGVFDLNDVSSVKSFSAIADGFAVVPVPAAAWLFGSGLLGLIGFARRKRA